MDKERFILEVKKMDYEDLFKLQQDVIPPFLALEQLSIREIQLRLDGNEIIIHFRHQKESFICKYRCLAKTVDCWIEIYFAPLDSYVQDEFTESLNCPDVHFVLREGFLVIGINLFHVLLAEQLYRVLDDLITAKLKHLPFFTPNSLGYVETLLKNMAAKPVTQTIN